MRQTPVNACSCATRLSAIVAISCTYALFVVGALFQANLICHALIPSSGSAFSLACRPWPKGVLCGFCSCLSRGIVANLCISISFALLSLHVTVLLQNASSLRRILLCFPRRLD